DAVHLGRDGGQRVRLLGTDSIRLRAARHPAAADEPGSSPRRRRSRPGRGCAPPRGRAAVLGASRSRRDARRDVRRGSQVHPQLEPRREAVAPRSAGSGGGVLVGSVGGGAEDNPMRGEAMSGAALSGAALSGAAMSGAALSGATLPGATLPGATLPGEALLDTAIRRRITRQRLFCSASLGIAFVLSCAPPTRYEQPDALRGYEILVTSHDSLGRGIAQGLARRGFRVRTRVRGG